jgi:hypothetical protein
MYYNNIVLIKIKEKDDDEDDLRRCQYSHHTNFCFPVTSYLYSELTRLGKEVSWMVRIGQYSRLPAVFCTPVQSHLAFVNQNEACVLNESYSVYHCHLQ